MRDRPQGGLALNSNVWRLAAGSAVLLLLVLVAALLAPSYLRNRELDRFLDEVVRQPAYRTAPAEVLQVAVADKAARLGIPLKPSQVLVSRHGESLRIDVRYVARVDFPLYTVGLHFRASGAR